MRRERGSGFGESGWAAVFVLLVLAASSCSVSSGDSAPIRSTDVGSGNATLPASSDGEPDSEDDDKDVPQNASDQAESSGDHGGLTPSQETVVADALFWIGFNTWEAQQWTTYRTEVELAITHQQDYIFDCMAEQGFEYFRRPAEGTIWTPIYSLPQDSRAWVERYGIGLSTTFFLQDQIAGESARGHVGDPQPIFDLREDSAEAIYLNSLGPDALSQYQLALTGVDPVTIQYVDGEPILPDDVDPSRSCEGEARTRFPRPIEPSPEAIALAQLVVASDEWVNETAATWDCMRGRGYAVSDINGISDMVGVELGQLGLFDDRYAKVNELPTLPPDFVELLHSGQDFEIEISLELWDCGAHPIQTRELFMLLAREEVLRSKIQLGGGD